MTKESLLGLAQALVAALEGSPGETLDKAKALVEMLDGSLPETDDQFWTLMTTDGAAEFVAAAAEQREVRYLELAIGDGNGSKVTPHEQMKSLVNEVYRVPISSITPDPQNPNFLILEGILPPAVGGWNVREVAAVGGKNGDVMMAVGSLPAAYKPMLSQGSTRDMRIRMVIHVGNASIVQLMVDPSVAVATAQTVVNALAAHVLQANPHPQYALLADLQTLLGSYALASDLVQHMLALDPHPQYAKVTDLVNYVTPEVMSVAIEGAKPNMAQMFFRSTL